MKFAYVGNFSQQHCTEVHLAATLEDLGHQVFRIQENSTPQAMLVDLVKDSDYFLFTRTWNTLVTLEHLEEFRKLGIPSISYHLDLYVGLKREDGLDNDPFWRTDYVFTPDGDPKSAEVFKRKGINHIYMRPGVFKQQCYYGTPKPELTHDVIFVGGGLEYAHPEWPYRHELVQFLMDTYGDRYGKYGHPQRTMRNNDLNDLYASSRVVVGDSVCVNFDHTYYWSDRIYETIGRGGFIIHPYIKGLEEEFNILNFSGHIGMKDCNLVTYPFGDFKRLKDLIDYYIEHDDEREQIRKAGHEFVKEHATYNNRLQRMVDIITGNDPNFAPPTAVTAKEDGLKINLGAGEDQFEGYINVDFIDLPGIDLVHNLMNFPYPFEDDSATNIKAVDVIEHLANYTPDGRPSVVAFVEECHRILKTGGELYIQTPGHNAAFLWTDPTHVRGFTTESMDFFDPETDYGKTTGFYSKAKFKVRVEELENHNLRFWMVKR